MNLHLDHTKTTSINGNISISGSKSESNRLLILQQLFSTIRIENLSNADDTKVLQKALNLFASSTNTSSNIDIGHAGTAMRFLTAFFAIQESKTVTLTGSKRMQERPIKILVDALCELGASISYLENEGYPPLLIKGKKLSKNKIAIKGNVSSQYVSALLLISPIFSKGLTIKLEKTITSKPYIEMTLALLKRIGVKTSFNSKKIIVKQPETQNPKLKTFFIEPDWSSASYYYSLVALQPNTKIQLLGFKKDSLQGDSILPKIYKIFGVKTSFTKTGIILESLNPTSNLSTDKVSLNPLILNLRNTPDLAQTLAVTCLGLGINCHLRGLHTLKIKETDRLQALKNELEKFGAKITLTNSSLYLESPEQFIKNVIVSTYQDHRMAMAFAPLSIKVPLLIENSIVVNKSYPNFWMNFNGLFK